MTTQQYTPDMDQARTIAADWHGGQSSALYSFASTGRVADADRLREEIHQCWREADREQRARLGALLRAVEHQHITQSRELARQLCHVEARQAHGISHTEPGAMDSDKDRVRADLQRARTMEFGVYVGFMAHQYGQVLDALAKAYQDPEMARAALLRHADQVIAQLAEDQD